MIALLKRPYIIDAGFYAQARKASLFGVFVFLFLSLFQPFELNTYPHNLWLLAAGYGAVCLLLMLVLNFLVPKMLPNYFAEETWNVGKHIFWTCVNVALIGLGNALFSQFMGVMQFNIRGIFLLELFTFSLAIFPTTAGVLWNENRLSKKFQQDSAKANQTIAGKKAGTKNLDKAVESKELLDVYSENVGENFTIHPKNLLFVKAAENYAEVFYAENSAVKKKVVRASLKRLEDTWVDFPQLFRCHKSYIANLQQVTRISGNAQGLKLHISDVNNPIPVSRQLNTAIKQKLENIV